MCEKRKGGVSIVAKELDKGGVPVVHLQDNCLDQLHIVLYALRMAVVNSEVFEEVDVEAWLRKDVD